MLFVFQTNRNAHCSWADARALQFFVRHVVVRTVDRKNHQRLNSTKTCRKKEELNAIAEAPRRRQPALHGERQHAPESPHLLPGELVVRMRLQAWIMHARDFRMFLQEFRYGDAVLALPLDSNAVSI